MFRSADPTPSDNQIRTPDEIASLNSDIKNFNTRYEALKNTNNKILGIIGYSVFSFFYTSWTWLITTSTLGGLNEYYNTTLRDLWRTRSKQDDEYQISLAKLLDNYFKLISTYGKNVTYDKRFLELTTLIVDLVEINDLEPQGIELLGSPGFLNIMANSRHRRTYKDTKDNIISGHAPPPNSAAHKQPNMFAPVVSYSSYALYGLKNQYRVGVSKPVQEKKTTLVENAMSLAGVVTEYLRPKQA